VVARRLAADGNEAALINANLAKLDTAATASVTINTRHHHHHHHQQQQQQQQQRWRRRPGITVEPTDEQCHQCHSLQRPANQLTTLVNVSSSRLCVNFSVASHLNRR